MPIRSLHSIDSSRRMYRLLLLFFRICSKKTQLACTSRPYKKSFQFPINNHNKFNKFWVHVLSVCLSSNFSVLSTELSVFWRVLSTNLPATTCDYQVKIQQVNKENHNLPTWNNTLLTALERHLVSNKLLHSTWKQHKHII